MKERKIFCLNEISRTGTDKFRQGYSLVDSIDEATLRGRGYRCI